MKRKALCAFALVLWVFLVCTMLSYRVEEWMVPWIDPIEYKTDEETLEQYLPLDTLVYEEEKPALYEIVEGTGWESGKQVKAVSAERYAIAPDRVVLYINYGYPYLHYTSKEFRDLDVIRLTTDVTERGEDHWLLTEPYQPERLQRAIEVEAQSNEAALFSVAGARLPYLPARAKNELLFWERDLPDDVTSAWGIYSLAEVEKMLAALPLLGVLLAGMLLSVGLWVLSCFLSKNASKNRAALLSNLGICAALLAALPFLLNAIDLPSSLLPQMNIFDVAHYQTEFREIFANLTGLADAGSQTAAAVLESAAQARLLCIGCVLLGAALLAAVVFAEIFIARKRGAPKGRHAKEKRA